jgi:hypothetical protein
LIILASTADRLQVVTSAATAIDAHVSYLDNASGTVTSGRVNTAITTAATTSIAGAAGAGAQRNVKSLFVRNKDASNPNTVTVVQTDGTTTVQLYSAVLAAGQTLQYADEVGFLVR